MCGCPLACVMCGGEIVKVKKKQWDEFLEIGSRETSFDWDVPGGYIRFGSFGVSFCKYFFEKGSTRLLWKRKIVNDWRNKTWKQVNEELANQEWEPF